ncbi:hypothetical protein AX15_003767 [Amanita polypyramis BW_CC]|nr:hypothetical protein AX15_003767 [Amanita polypyramis BW_CC]
MTLLPTLLHLGSIVMANVWAITRTRDETVYPDPVSFKPERFFDSDGTLNNDTMQYAIGFGRRICPGRAIADAVLLLVTDTVLSTFNISKAKDENGIEIEIDLNSFTSSAVKQVRIVRVRRCILTSLLTRLPFKCSNVPRFPQARVLIRNAISER